MLLKWWDWWALWPYSLAVIALIVAVIDAAWLYIGKPRGVDRLSAITVLVLTLGFALLMGLNLWYALTCSPNCL
jgi:uncharacterized membrane protein